MESEQKTRTPEQERQHQAWLKWYQSDKGKAYRQKRKEANAEPAESAVEEVK